MVNLKVFRWNISTSMNLLFLKNGFPTKDTISFLFTCISNLVLDSVEIFAPNNTCSGTSLRSFPKPIVGSFGGYVAGKVNN